MIPDMRELIMRGRIIILSMCMRISPGNDNSMIVCGSRFKGRITKPSSAPNSTEATVQTKSKFFRNQVILKRKNRFFFNLAEQIFRR